MTIKACLFDLDGVLVDTAHFHFLAWKQLADELGFVFTEDHNERLKGVSRMDSLEILLEVGNITLSGNKKIEVASQKNQRYLEYIKSMTPEDVLPGVRDFLKALKISGTLLGIGSASKNAMIILEKTGLESLFNVIVDGNLISTAKPNPEVFVTGARMLRTYPQNCIVFEDAVAGIQAAHLAGMKCVGVGSPETLYEADYIIPGFSEFKLSDLPF